MSTMLELDWFTSAGPTHADKLAALAWFVYTEYRREEDHRTDGPMMTFDNMCSGNLERAAGVLEASGFVEFIDDIGRRSIFVIEPDDFVAVAGSQRAAQIDPALVEEAARCLALWDYQPAFSLGEFFEKLHKAKL